MPKKRSIVAKFTLFFFCLLLAGGGAHEARAGGEALRVAVVGDTGIGERAFHPGFLAVAEAMKEQHPDVLVHLGDFVYQPEMMPETCPGRYLDEIRQKLVTPFPVRLFVAGDNDLPPAIKKPKASGCWPGIAQMATALDRPPGAGEREGIRETGPAFFAVIESFPYQNPAPWLAGEVKRAREKGLFVIFLLHEPAITTAWFLDKREGELKDLNALAPDLVLAGNQHSYERFLPLGEPGPGGALTVHAGEGPVYARGGGTHHIVTGGGGATFKPFADMQGQKARVAPPEVFKAVKTRALMNHFVLLEITREKLLATTYRVCAGPAAEREQNPRWRPGMPVWKTTPLSCDNQPAGVTAYDRFEIRSGH